MVWRGECLVDASVWLHLPCTERPEYATTRVHIEHDFGTALQHVVHLTLCEVPVLQAHLWYLTVDRVVLLNQLHQHRVTGGTLLNRGQVCHRLVFEVQWLSLIH